jgi:plasmid replication initiation protein
MSKSKTDMKEVTRYKNEMNHIPMRRWTAEEMNFFFAVLTRMRDEGTHLIVMDKHELAESVAENEDGIQYQYNLEGTE